ncbi:hypothetical protein ES708_35124 [subsurface metagenome]
MTQGLEKRNYLDVMPVGKIYQFPYFIFAKGLFVIKRRVFFIGKFISVFNNQGIYFVFA